MDDGTGPLTLQLPGEGGEPPTLPPGMVEWGAAGMLKVRRQQYPVVYAHGIKSYCGADITL